MKPVLAATILLGTALLLSGCGNTDALSETQDQTTLSTENLEQLKISILALDHNRLAQPAKGTDLNQLLADGSTLLAWAVESQDLTNVHILLNHGAQTDTDQPEANHFTPMILACQYGQTDILMRLLDEKPNLNHQTDEGITPLALCAGSAALRVVERMISMGAEVDAADSHGQTPLMHAAANGQLDVMRVLLNQGAAINRETQQGFTPLFFAIKTGQLSPAMVTVDAGANINHQSEDGTTALQLALYQHNYEFAHWLIEQGADLAAYDRNGHQPLHKAVLGNQPELVQLLLETGVDPNNPSGPSKMTWRYESNFKIEDYEPPSLSPLFMAAQTGAAEIMQLLADAEATPDFVDEHGNNLVLAAASSGSPAALATALKLLPNPTQANSYGQTPLDLVLLQTDKITQSALLEILEQQGVDISVTNTNS